MEVEVKRKLRSVNKGNDIEYILKPLTEVKEDGKLLWRVKMLRNMSAHTQYIPKHLKVEIGGGRSLRLPLDPRNPSKPNDEDLVPDFEEVLV